MDSNIFIASKKKHKNRFISISIGLYCYLWRWICEEYLFVVFLVGFEHLSACWSGSQKSHQHQHECVLIIFGKRFCRGLFSIKLQLQGRVITGLLFQRVSSNPPTTDHRPTYNRPTNHRPLTHRPTDQPTTDPPTQ